VVLDPKKWVALPLIEREELSHDTRRFRFGLPSPQHRLGLPVGQHIFLKATIDGKMVMRAYTPISSDSQLGSVDFVIKVYFKNTHPRFPEGGKLTQHMETMKLGDTLDFKGPLGEFIFTPPPPLEPAFATLTHARSGEKQKFDEIGFIAGGSGITPVLQVLTNLLSDKSAKVRAWVLYANQSPADILCGDTLDAFAKDERVKIWYTVDRPTPSWTYSTGFINEAMIAEHMPPAAPNRLVMMCGPPPMIKFACIPNLEKHGYTEKNYFCF